MLSLKFHASSHGSVAGVLRRFLVKPLAIVLFAGFLGGCISEGEDAAIDGTPPVRQWELVWSDEFDGTELDLNNWEIQLGDGSAYGIPGWGNNEEQYYTAENVSVDNGNLVITSTREDFTGADVDPAFGNPSNTYEYTSARITTSGKFELTYGRVEARIKMPATKGIWNAFWLLGSEMSPYGGWPGKGEIDIIETYKRGDPTVIGNDPLVSGAAHFGATGPGENREFLFEEKRPFNHFDDFHVYAVEWDAEKIRWFVDGENFFTLNKGNYWNYYNDAVEGYKAGGPSAPFDEDQYIILNAAVGGDLPAGVGESPDPMTFGSDEMLVDYVRVYKCSFNPATGEGCKNLIDSIEGSVENEGRRDGFAYLADLYIDGPGAEDLPPAKEIALAPINGAVVSELTENGNTYIDIVAGEVVGGNIPGVGIVDPNGENLTLAGFNNPNSLGDFKFDLYVESDSAFITDSPPPAAAFRVSILDNNSGKGALLPIADFEPDTWHRVLLPISDILNGATIGSGALDTGQIQDLVRFELRNAHIRIDNLQLACGGLLPCGVVDEIEVFIDEVASFWDRGIVGNDQDQVLAGNPDYVNNSLYHVQWDVLDSADLNTFDLDEFGDPTPRGKVIQSRFGTTGADGAVNFIGSNGAIPTVGALTQGEFRFDIKLTRNDENALLFFKLDGTFSSTGEQSLGQLNLNEWTRISCPMKTLVSQGLDINTVTAPFVMVPGNNGAAQGVTVELDNILFSPVISSTPPAITLPIVFNDLPGFCLPIQTFERAAFASIDNPTGTSDPVNPNPIVGRTIKFQNFEEKFFGGISITTETPTVIGAPGSPVNKAFRIKTYSSRVGLPVTFKLDTFGAGPERVFQTTVANQWEEHIVDFNGTPESTHRSITIILDNGVNGNGTGNFTLYFDQIEQIDSPNTVASLDPILTFDEPGLTYPLTDFGNAQSEVTETFPADTAAFIDSAAERASGSVVKVTLNDFAQGQGPGTILSGDSGYETPIPFAADRTTLRFRVNFPAGGGKMLVKVEDSVDSFQAAEIEQTTFTGGWQTLDFDFSTVSINTADSFEKVVVLFDFGEAHNGEEYYIDNVELLPAP